MKLANPPSKEHIHELRSKIEREVINTLKGYQNFSSFDSFGGQFIWKPHELCEELIRDLPERELGQILAAVLDYRPDRKDQIFLEYAQRLLKEKVIEPFIDEEVALRTEI